MISAGFEGSHFEFVIPLISIAAILKMASTQVVHLDLLIVISTFHVHTIPRNKIKCLIHSWGGGGGCTSDKDYGRYMAKPVLDGGHFVYAN